MRGWKIPNSVLDQGTVTQYEHDGEWGRTDWFDLSAGFDLTVLVGPSRFVRFTVQIHP